MDITLAAIKHGASQLKEGMSQGELSSIITKAQNELGGSADFALCLFGTSSAFPHGSNQPQQLKQGDIVLMDCGCLVEGYIQTSHELSFLENRRRDSRRSGR
ncbi:MAG: M24 family metallopeptidase [Bacteroidota bacterium]